MVLFVVNRAELTRSHALYQVVRVYGERVFRSTFKCGMVKLRRVPYLERDAHGGLTQPRVARKEVEGMHVEVLLYAVNGSYPLLT